ncbi:MAG: type II secretion system protein [Planctomycetota bacterium]|nr:type II secretion system protein [Planctomycetota bacterium]
MITRRYYPRPVGTTASGILASGARQLPAALARRMWRTSFTLVELLTVVMIISILASTVLFALFKATQEAKIARTKAQVQRLNQLLLTRWESYRTRAIRIPIPNGTSPRVAAQMRLNALRELMRLEMPDRITDVVRPLDFFPSPAPAWLPSQYSSPNVLPLPALARHYWNVRYRNSQSSSTDKWLPSYQGAECLYMIIAAIHENGTSGLDFLQAGEIGDVDEDGMPEILDAWGHPIEFLRWAPGLVALPGPDGQWGVAGTDDDNSGTVDDFSERLWGGSDDVPGLTTLMNGDPNTSPDPFDPLRIYPGTFALYPYIYSAGVDGKYDVMSDTKVRLDYGLFNPPNDPYRVLPMDPPVPPQITPPKYAPLGTCFDVDADGIFSYTDNITNHFFEVK